jgi:hypothetical protein
MHFLKFSQKTSAHKQLAKSFEDLSLISSHMLPARSNNAEIVFLLDPAVERDYLQILRGFVLLKPKK